MKIGKASYMQIVGWATIVFVKETVVAYHMQ